MIKDELGLFILKQSTMQSRGAEWRASVGKQYEAKCCNEIRAGILIIIGWETNIYYNKS